MAQRVRDRITNRARIREGVGFALLALAGLALSALFGWQAVLGWVAGGALITLFSWLIFDKWLGGYQRKADMYARGITPIDSDGEQLH